MKTILVTSHVWKSSRKAGFHWLAYELNNMGHDVLFLCGLSSIDIFKKDYRTEFMLQEGKNKIIHENDNIYSYFLYNRFRPFNTNYPLVNKFSKFLFYSYGNMIPDNLKCQVECADLIVFESVNEIMYFDTFKKINPRAKFVYRSSDDMSIRNTHQLVLENEARLLNEFDLVSVPATPLYDRFSGLSSLVLHPHGVPSRLYDMDYISPYQESDKKNAIFVGSNFLDTTFIDVVSLGFPDINFHIIGPVNYTSNLPNVYIYGEMQYEKTIPYIKYADIALSPMTLPSFTDSNKIKQYNYCRLPVVISSINLSSNENFIYYHLNDEKSMIKSLETALEFSPDEVVFSQIDSWSDVTKGILDSVGLKDTVR